MFLKCQSLTKCYIIYNIQAHESVKLHNNNISYQSKADIPKKINLPNFIVND